MIRLAFALLLAALPAAAQQRVLSIGGAATEIAFALGAGPVLVGTDTTSTFPPAATRLPSVGYMRALAAEGMLSLDPDLVLLLPDAGPPAALQQAADAGLTLVRLPGGNSAPALLQRIEAIGAALHREADARRLAEDVRADLAQVQAGVSSLPGRPRVLFLLSAGRGAPLAGGAGSAADAMIALAGGVNAVGAMAGYKSLSPEAAVDAAPDVLLMFRHAVDELGGADTVLALPELAGTKAAQERRLVAMDATYLLGFGPRLPRAVRDLALALRPGTALPPLPPRPWAPE